MSKASRAWKESCKSNNRLTNGTSWSRKDMTLRSHMMIKRYDRKFHKRRNVRYLVEGLKELDAGKGIAFNPLEDMAMVEHDGISHLTAISEDVGTITTTGGEHDQREDIR